MKKSTPIPVQKPCWYFLDRGGHRFGPYYDEQEVLNILKFNVVHAAFGPMPEDHDLVDYVMQDADMRPVCPIAWQQVRYDRKRKALREKYLKKMGTYRCGPVYGCGHYTWAGRSSHFGHNLRSNVDFYPEEGEKPIRNRTKVNNNYWGGSYRRCEKKLEKSSQNAMERGLTEWIMG